MPAQHRDVPPNPIDGALPTHHQVGVGEHAVIVSNAIDGYTQHDGKTVNLAPHVFFFPTQEEAASFAESVEVEHVRRGTHPVQKECEALNLRDQIHPGGLGWSEEVITAHQAAHKALNKKAGL